MTDPTYRMSMLPFGTYPNDDGQGEHLGLAVPGMIQEPVNALMRLFGSGNFAQGPDYPGNADDMRTLLFSMYGGNALNPLTTLPENAVGMFAGRMAKTADHAALARAEDLAAKGAPRDQIWNETGWFQGPDGKWRFEIDDSKSSMIDPFESTGTYDKFVAAHVPQVQNTNRIPQALGLEDYLSHPDLERAYWPVREDAPSVIFDNLGKSRGRYSEPSDMVTMDSGSFLAPDLGHSTALHELQHAIQGREGFARGASTDDFTYQNSPLFNERRSYESPYDSYRRVAGEVEARNVQKRMNMTPEERRATPPWETQDVPDSNQIVRLFSDTGKPSLMGSAIAAESAPQRMYHGTATADDFSHFIPSENGAFGPGVYLSREADSTNPYAFNGPNPRVMPVDVSGPLATYDDYLAARNASPDQAATVQALLDRGFSGVSVDNATPKGSVNVTNVFRPGSVRSATTGETLFSDGLPSLWGNALAPSQEPRNALMDYAQNDQGSGDYLKKHMDQPYQPAPGEDFQYRQDPADVQRLQDWIGRHQRHDLPPKQAEELMKRDPEYQRLYRKLWTPSPYNPEPPLR